MLSREMINTMANVAGAALAKQRMIEAEMSMRKAYADRQVFEDKTRVPKVERVK